MHVLCRCELEACRHFAPSQQLTHHLCAHALHFCHCSYGSYFQIHAWPASFALYILNSCAQNMNTHFLLKWPQRRETYASVETWLGGPCNIWWTHCCINLAWFSPETDCKEWVGIHVYNYLCLSNSMHVGPVCMQTDAWKCEQSPNLVSVIAESTHTVQMLFWSAFELSSMRGKQNTREHVFKCIVCINAILILQPGFSYVSSPQMPTHITKTNIRHICTNAFTYFDISTYASTSTSDLTYTNTCTSTCTYAYARACAQYPYPYPYTYPPPELCAYLHTHMYAYSNTYTILITVRISM